MIGIVDCRPIGRDANWAGCASENLVLFDRSFLQHTIEQLVQAGVSHCILIADQAEEIALELGNGSRWGCRLDVCPSSSITSLLAGISEKPLMIARGDCIPRVAATALNGRKSTTVLFLDRAREGGPAREAFTGWAITAPEVLLRSSFATEGADGLLRQGPCHAVRCQYVAGACLHAESPEALLRSQRMVLDGEMPEILFDGAEIRPGVFVGRNAAIHPDAKILGKAYIGHEASIAAGAVLEDCVVVGRGSLIEQGAWLSNVAVLPGTFVGREVHMVDAVATPEAVIRPGETIPRVVRNPRVLGRADITVREAASLLLKAVRMILNIEPAAQHACCTPNRAARHPFGIRKNLAA